jgi:hypothetical protein
VKQSVSPCETHSTGKLKFFDTAFGDFFPYFGFWQLAFGFPLAKVAKSQRLRLKDNKSTRQRDNKICGICGLSKNFCIFAGEL